MNTAELIHTLAENTGTAKKLRAPKNLLVRLSLGLFAYAVLAALMQGIRPDLALQLQRPLFLAELASLSGVVFASLVAAVYLVFPDSYQHPTITRWPAYARA